LIAPVIIQNHLYKLTSRDVKKIYVFSIVASSSARKDYHHHATLKIVDWVALEAFVLCDVAGDSREAKKCNNSL